MTTYILETEEAIDSFLADLRKRLLKAKKVLYTTDNAGSCYAPTKAYPCYRLPFAFSPKSVDDLDELLKANRVAIVWRNDNDTN